jgi:protein-tyrosine phosphatase
VLRERGIDYNHCARVVRAVDFDTFDYIVALDSVNLADLRALARGHQGKLARLLDYAAGVPLRDVPDPYYTGRFDEVYDLVEQGGRGLLERIVAEQGLAAKT